MRHHLRLVQACTSPACREQGFKALFKKWRAQRMHTVGTLFLHAVVEAHHMLTTGPGERGNCCDWCGAQGGMHPAVHVWTEVS